jgi:ribose/xylose/arabinose/galactoside ABC-type transport system permease subunit
MRDDPLARELQLAFAPVHKRAFGIALGVGSALVCFAMTAVYLMRTPQPAFRLDLLAEYFYGYTVSWRGAVVALVWGFVVGFVAGWFVAFCRNLTLATLLFIRRTRAELAATRTFLDHI